MPTLEVWFDYLSPYAFLAWLEVRALAERHGAELVPIPTLLAALLDHHGQLGPAEIPSKRAYTFRDVARLCAHRRIPIRGPARHPFHPLIALRCSLREVAGDRQLEVVDTLFRATWQGGIDPGDPAAVARALEERGLPGAAIVERTREPEVKQALADATSRAVAAGVFGVPTVRCDGELFWGHDRLAFVELRLLGKDPLTPEVAAALAAIPEGPRRPRR